MRATAPRRFRKATAVGVSALMVAGTSLVFTAMPASAAAPVIVNSANSASTAIMGNWLEGNSVASVDRSAGVGASSDVVNGTLVVQHDPGRTVTGLAIDSDWNTTDDTATVTPVAVSSSQVTGGASNYSTVRFSYNPPDAPNLRGTTVILCLLSGNSAPSGPQRVRAVLDDGTRTAPVSNTVNMIQSQDCGGTTEFPTLYSAQQSATQVAPGGTVTFQFKGDDVDSSGSNDAFDKYRWRVRRLNDGAIVQGPTCVDLAGSGSDNVNQTLNVNFTNGRGRYVVETELGGEDESCPSGNFSSVAAASARWWRIGAVDVNTAAATSPTLTLSGAPALIQAGNSYTVTATTADSDTTGRIQAIDWDADGTPGVERRVLADEPVGITAADRVQNVPTVVGQCADRTVTAHVVDNGAMNGADPSRAEKTVSAVTEVNCAPVANDQSVSTTEDAPASFSINPTDGDGNPLAYSVTNPPDHGAISGTYPNFVYNPDSNFNGTDSYTYKVDDGRGGSDTATVTFTVAAVNDAPTAADLTTSTPEDTPIVIDLDPSVSDPDEPGQTLGVSIVTGPATGVATVTGPTEITYTPNPPANFNGVVSIVYQVDDGQGAANSTDNGTITINVDPVDDAPVAADQSVSTPEDTNLNVNLGPTTDVDDETVTYSVPPALQPAHGSVSISGTVATYDPDPDYFGPDEFMFQATDGNSVTTGTVTVDVTPVNDAPVAQSQDVSTPEDTALSITLGAIDVDNTPDQLSYTVIGQPNHGTLDTTTGASLVYTPDLNYNGPDALTFQVSDGSLTSTASISITVVPVNDAPVADDGSAVTDEDTPVPVLLSASDVDNTQAQLTYTVTVPPQFGTLSGAGNDLVYTPNLNYNGPDSFQFQVSDGDLTDEGEWTLTVNATNDPPEAIPQSLTTPEDTALPITLDATDVDDATSTLTFEVVGGPSHGTLDTTTGQALTYTPATDYNGYDALVFRVTDPSGTTDTATVVIAVGDPGTNDLPTADDQQVTTDEDTDLGIVVSGSDVDGDDLAYSIEVAPDHGTVQILNDSVIYSPNLNYHGADMFVFKVDDGHGGFNFGTVDITVTSVNDAPEAIPATVELVEDTPTAITLSATDVEGDPITYSVTTPPSHGTLTGTAPNLTYTPAADYNGNDAFEFTATDSHGDSTTAEISLVVDAAPKLTSVMFAEGAIATLVKVGPTLLVSIPLTAHLTDTAGHGLAGRTVQFTTGNGALKVLCTAVTDSTGTATCTSVTSTVVAILNLGYTAYFAGDEDYLPVSDAGPLIRAFGLKII